METWIFLLSGLAGVLYALRVETLLSRNRKKLRNAFIRIDNLERYTGLAQTETDLRTGSKKTRRTKDPRAAK